MDEDREPLEQILETCVELIWTGQETADSVLALYPDSAEALKRELKVRLWFRAAKSDLDPRPGVIRASRLRLEERIRQEAVIKQPAPPAPAISPLQALGNWLQQIPTRQLQFALSFVLVIGFILIAQVTLAAAQDSIPGEALYPIKTAQEKVQLAVTLTDAQEARLRIRFTQQRLLEVQTLAMKGRYAYVPGAVANYEEQVQKTLSTLQEVDRQKPGQAKALAADFQNVLSDQAGIESILVAGVPSEVQADLQRALIVSDQGISAVQAVMQEGGPSSLPGGAPTSSPTPALTSTSTEFSYPLPPGVSQPTPELESPLAPPTQTIVPSSTSPVPGVLSTPLPKTTSTVIGKKAPSPTPTATPTLEKQPTAKPTKESKPTPKPTNEKRPTPKPTNENRPTKKPN